MALLICPECKAQVSEFAERCMQCGCPISIIKSGIETNEITNDNEIDIGDQKYDISEVYELISGDKKVFAVKRLREICNIDIVLAKKICDEIQQKGRIESSNIFSADPNMPICPECGSTAITAGPLGTWGLPSLSDRTRNRCANCGHSWTPRKR